MFKRSFIIIIKEKEKRVPGREKANWRENVKFFFFSKWSFIFCPTHTNLHSRITDSYELLLREGEGLLSGKAVVLNQVDP